MAGDGARCLALHAATPTLVFRFALGAGMPDSKPPISRLHAAVWRGGRTFMSALSASSAVSHLMRSSPLMASTPLDGTEGRQHKYILSCSECFWSLRDH